MYVFAISLLLHSFLDPQLASGVIFPPPEALPFIRVSACVSACMWACAHVCVCACALCWCVHMCLCACVPVHCVCMCVHVCARTCVSHVYYVYVCTRVCVHVCLCVHCVCVCMCVHMCVHVLACTCAWCACLCFCAHGLMCLSAALLLSALPPLLRHCSSTRVPSQLLEIRSADF